MKPPEGETRTFERTFTTDEVRRFAELSGDDQPRHSEPDEDGRLLVHGLLTATLPTKVGGDLGVLAHTMEFEFARPVYTGETITCTVRTATVEERDDRYRIVAEVTCTNERDEVVLTGSFTGFVRKE